MTAPDHLEQSETLVHQNDALDVEQVDTKSASLNESDDQTDWKSIYWTSLLTFFTAVQFSLFYAGLWPYLQLIDAETSESFFGYIVGIYSLGQILGSPLVGFWANKIKRISVPLYFNILLLFVGNFSFICLELVLSNHRYMLLVIRFITGFGSSNISILKSYTASASHSNDRSRSIAFVTGGIAVGMFSGPALQIFFVPLGYPGYNLFFGLKLNMYNAPAYMACLLNLICALVVKLFFRESYAGLLNRNTENGAKIQLPKFDRVAITICHVTRFTQILTNSTLETLAAPLTMALFAWSRHDVVENIALAQLIMSFLAFTTYLLFIVFNADRYLNFRMCLIGSLVGLSAFYIITWPVAVPSKQCAKSAVEEQLGCDADRFSWCYSLKQVNVVLFYLSYVFIIGFAFAMVNITLNTLFSKILGPRRQGTQQGLLQVSGGIARLVGPIVMASIYMKHGPQFVWAFVICVIGLNIALWCIYYQRMVPLKIPEDYTSFTQPSTGNESRQKLVNVEDRASG
ncbi:hypothetical protein M3Y97_00283000 [Aphelenchoides bicaudatus]|nr:hypothetical protein M3Y97_00283000 [Aphelenchoides bicaudatus]